MLQYLTPSIHNGWFVFTVVFIALVITDILTSIGKEQSMRYSIWLTVAYVAVSLVFNAYVYWAYGTQVATEWLTGYVLEKSLSVDNLFVISIIMASFQVPNAQKRTLLYCGLVGAAILRAGFIFGGIALVNSFAWILPLMGAFLLYTGAKILLSKKDEGEEEPAIVRWAKKLNIPTFWAALFAIEVVDLIFAVDSVPAILAVSTNPFVAYTAPMFSLLGLRSLYFVLEHANATFKYLPYAIGLVLIWIGFKIILAKGYTLFAFMPEMHVHNMLSLGITLGLLTGGIVLSIMDKRKSA